jgi:hypothetical protein
MRAILISVTKPKHVVSSKQSTPTWFHNKVNIELEHGEYIDRGIFT